MFAISKLLLHDGYYRLKIRIFQFKALSKGCFFWFRSRSKVIRFLSTNWIKMNPNRWKGPNQINVIQFLLVIHIRSPDASIWLSTENPTKSKVSHDIMYRWRYRPKIFDAMIDISRFENDWYFPMSIRFDYIFFLQFEYSNWNSLISVFFMCFVMLKRTHHRKQHEVYVNLILDVQRNFGKTMYQNMVWNVDIGVDTFYPFWIYVLFIWIFHHRPKSNRCHSYRKCSWHIRIQENDKFSL